VDSIALALRIVLSLAVVLGVMWALSRVVRGHGTVRTVPVDVVSRAPLGRRSSVVVVRVGDRGVLLGVTDHQVSLLGDIELPGPAPVAQRRTAVDLSDAIGSPGPGDPGPPADDVAGALAGSMLSLRTWRQAGVALRERTVRT
jgi:flagellar protein FliO/FliZ